jgi:hypothetical protein
LTTIFSAIILYLVLLSYAFGVYPIIPANRGGKRPITQAVIVISDKVSLQYPEIIDKKSVDQYATIPLSILEQTGDTLYLVKPQPPFSEQHIECVYVIKRSDISSMVYRECIGK